MTSRDGYNRNRPTRGSSQSPRDSRRQGAGWELDADELDRYMSGQPAKEPRFNPYGRSQSTERTERIPEQPPRQQTQQPQYSDYDNRAPLPDDQWVDDDYGYEDEFEYEEFQPEEPQQQSTATRRTPAAPPRRRQVEPEYDDDLYDDPYVIDDEEAPRRPRRRSQKSSSQNRAPRQAPSFALPNAITNTPIAKDQTALAMLGVAFISLLAMLIIVTTRRDVLGDVIFTHVNANGEPANLQTAEAIWNLPLIAAMVMLISGALAWFLARWDTFLPRFVLGGAIAIHFVTWVAVIAYLF